MALAVHCATQPPSQPIAAIEEEPLQKPVELDIITSDNASDDFPHGDPGDDLFLGDVERTANKWAQEAVETDILIGNDAPDNIGRTNL